MQLLLTRAAAFTAHHEAPKQMAQTRMFPACGRLPLHPSAHNSTRVMTQSFVFHKRHCG